MTPTPLTPARLDEIEAAVPTIAPGPWRLERGNALGEWVVWSGQDDPILQILIWGSEIGPFVEAVRTIVPELAAEVRRLHREIAAANGALAAAVHRLQLEVPPLKAERDDWRSRAEDALGEVGALQAEILKALAAHDRLSRALADAEHERDGLRSRIAAARREVALQDVRATNAARPGFSDVCDGLAAIETHLAEPEAER